MNSTNKPSTKPQPSASLKKPNTNSAVNLSNLNMSNAIDYKELTKTLAQYQQSKGIEQSPGISKSKQGPSLSPLKNKSLIDINFLKNAGILNIKSDDEDNGDHPKGIEISYEDIEKAFKILDEKSGGSKVSLNELKKKIPVINPNFPIGEIQTLTNGKAELKAKDLYELLRHNELENFDPLEEAYNLLDPNKTGSIDITRLRQIFTILGYEDIDKKDVVILNECLDADGDGKISIEDLRKVYESMNKK